MLPPKDTRSLLIPTAIEVLLSNRVGKFSGFFCNPHLIAATLKISVFVLLIGVLHHALISEFPLISSGFCNPLGVYKGLLNNTAQVFSR